MSYKFNPFTKKPDYYETSSAGSVDEVARDNIVVLAWKLAIAEGLSVFDLEDGVVDEFEDETGVDTTASTGESYNSTDDYYSPYVATVVDNMEYSSDANAQAAYVTASSNEYGSAIESKPSTTAGNNTCINTNAAYLIGKAGNIRKVKYYTSTASVNIKFKVFRVNGSNYDFVGESETFATVAGGATRTLTTPIYGVQANDIIGFYTPSNLENNIDAAGGSGCHYKSGDVTTDTAKATWSAAAAGVFPASCVIVDVEGFSESTIKTQGSYSLKCIATTGALNDTLTRDLASVVDLSGVSWITIDLRSDRTGGNIAFGMQQSISVSASLTPTIVSAGSFERFIWSLDAISNGAKNKISALYITLVNADASNTFYVDRWAGPIVNMTLISESSEAEDEPTEGRFLALVEPVDSITVNTDLLAYISNDDGSNYDQVTLEDEGYFDSTKKILSGNVTLTDRSDKTMVQKIETANNKDLKVHAWGMLWK